MSSEAVTNTMHDVARRAVSSFETARRRDDSQYSRLKDDSPQWLHELVFQAHNNGQILPDDWRYRFTVDALSHIADADHGATRTDLRDDIEADVYISDLTNWLGSHTIRLGYCDEALTMLGRTGTLSQLLAEGQILERQEVFDIVWSTLASEDAAPAV